MANPYEQREDPFAERPDPTDVTNPPTAPTTAKTPFAQPQTTYTPAENAGLFARAQGFGPGYPPQGPGQIFYDGSAASAAPPPPPPSTTTAATFPSVEKFFPTTAQQSADQQQEQQQQQQGPTSRFWTIEFYQQFFDVDTRLVLLRMSNALVPINPPDFLMDREWRNDAIQTPQYEFEEAGVTLSRKPDLYGPFWICTTLWMTLGIVSNLMSRIAFSHQPTDNTEKWEYDFTMASVACIVIYIYCFGLGCAVWGVMKYKELPVSLLDTLCLYGYSMFIFLPVAILCTIPVSALQWVIVMVGGAWSAAFLLINFWRLWKITLSRAWFLGIVAVVSVFHMVLTMSFKFYFLNYKF